MDGCSPEAWWDLQRLLLSWLCACAVALASCCGALPGGAHALPAHPQRARQADVLQLGSVPRSAGGARREAVIAPAAPSPAAVGEVSSDLEDGLLQALREIQFGVDSAVGAVTSTLPTNSSAQVDSAVSSVARALITEVWEVVDTYYMDARGGGFDHGAWAALRDRALAQRYQDKAAVYRAVRDMLARGVFDPYSRFITPGEFSGMKKYDVTGVGLNLGTGEEYTRKTGRPLPSGRSSAVGGVWVVGLSKGSAADAAGVQQGDQLLAIDGQTVSALSPFQAASLIAGPDDAAASAAPNAITLQVMREDGSRANVSLVRPARALASPVTARLDTRGGGRRVGVVRLTAFNARAQRDVAAALQRLDAQGADEFELDLRDNRGGLVSEGLEVARLFLRPGSPIVLTESKAMASEPPRAGPGAPLTTKPLAVLVNDHTASASEILAGALKDNCRAVLVGSKTYGKGLIQSVYELSDSSGLVITVGKYLTPDGVDIDRYGIVPNFGAHPSPQTAREAINACLLAAAGPNPRG